MHALASRLRIAALLLRLGFACQISSHPVGHASLSFYFRSCSVFLGSDSCLDRAVLIGGMPRLSRSSAECTTVC